MRLKIKKEIINKIKEKQKEKERVYKLYDHVSVHITKHEMHRLKKVLKYEENEQKLKDWAFGLGRRVDTNIAKQYKEYYDKKLEENLMEAIGNMNATIVYTLHNNEKCKFGSKRIQDFMEDYLVTYELFAKEELTVADLLKQLKDDGIEVVFKES